MNALSMKWASRTFYYTCRLVQSRQDLPRYSLQTIDTSYLGLLRLRLHLTLGDIADNAFL